MTSAPLPWTPRPCVGESLSGWVERVASRYGLAADGLCRHLLDGHGLGVGRVERLDHRADPELVELLAAATGIAPARLRAMRVAADNGTASCWFRENAAWCPECVRNDLARGPEFHERATWRLGCSVVCLDHAVPLQDACGRCWDGPRCHFKAAEGWLGLSCGQCRRLPYEPDQPAGRLEFDRPGVFDVRLTPGLAALVGELQHDLQAALLGAPLSRPWGAVRSGPLLLRVVRDLALSVALSRDVGFEQRTELVVDRGRVPYVTVQYEPVTPAALSTWAAFGALAITAAVLDGMGRDGGAGHAWHGRGGPLAITRASFVEWLGGRARGWLRAAARRWDHPVRTAFEGDI